MAEADPALDRRFMALALALAGRGLGNVWPNPAVGCVLVRDGRVDGGQIIDHLLALLSH